jgi:hypothetical protein
VGHHTRERLDLAGSWIVQPPGSTLLLSPAALLSDLVGTRGTLAAGGLATAVKLPALCPALVLAAMCLPAVCTAPGIRRRRLPPGAVGGSVGPTCATATRWHDTSWADVSGSGHIVARRGISRADP